jgi:hypothetical protein
LTQRTFAHERAIAKDQRVQERISSAYVEFLAMLDWIMGIVDATQPILEPDPSRRRSGSEKVGPGCKHQLPDCSWEGNIEGAPGNR